MPHQASAELSDMTAQAKMKSETKAKTKTPAVKQRNSSIELLRIIAMYMILAHHFIVHNAFAANDLPFGIQKMFFQLVMAAGGKVGVIIFFSISAWFFLDKEQTIKSCWRRVWLMEREVLFWSLCLVAFYLIFDRADITGLPDNLVLKSFFPLNTGVWWYATSYAVFLILLPFLDKGLRAIGRRYHLILAATMLVLYGLRSFLPDLMDATPLGSVLAFTYIFILISAYKWYMKPFTTWQAWLLIIIGFAFFCLYTSLSVYKAKQGIFMDIYIVNDWKMPVMMIGFGMFLLFQRITFHSRIINRIAQSAFAVYLITDYEASEKLLWTRLFNLQDLVALRHAIPRILLILLAIYVICTLLDFVRQALFALTIDRHQGRWFNHLWNAAVRKIESRSHRDHSQTSERTASEEL